MPPVRGECSLKKWRGSGVSNAEGGGGSLVRDVAREETPEPGRASGFYFLGCVVPKSLLLTLNLQIHKEK